MVMAVYERYPGHADARRLWAEAQGREGLPAARKKIFYEQHFAIPNNVTTYQRLGDGFAAPQSQARGSATDSPGRGGAGTSRIESPLHVSPI